MTGAALLCRVKVHYIGFQRFAVGGQSANPMLTPIAELLPFAGARKMELLRARWSDVDLIRKAWHIPESKTGKPRYVPLSTAAIDVIVALPRFDNCPWLILNPDTRKPYIDINGPRPC
jgi:integrase